MNNVYVRSNKSIKTITLTRIMFILPMLIYGFYKNGIYLKMKGFVSVPMMFKPLLIIFISACIGGFVNIIYEYIFKRSKADISSVVFSSFHVEYGILIASVMPINIKMIPYFIILFIILMISKFLKNRMNVCCITFIVLYFVLKYLGNSFDFANIYEVSRVFNYHFMDYMIGRGIGGIASTHILLLIMALFGLSITNNNKTTISVISIITYIVLVFISGLITNGNITEMIFANNILFFFSFIATDSVTSTYTRNGMILFGLLIGILTFALSYYNPILAPAISITIVSLFNNLIDRKVNNKFTNILQKNI